MSNKLISIIIPTLNEEENLKSLVPYLIQSTSENIEIIIADSCMSDDNTKVICDVYSVKRIICQDCSRAKQMNKGAEIAQGEILYFLHADAKPPLTFEKDIRESLLDGFDFGIFSYTFESDSILLKINAHSTRRKSIFSGGGDQSIFMSIDTFNSIGRFDPRYCLMEDFRFFHTAKKMKMTYTIVPHDILISARKYDKNSYLRVNVVNLIAFSMYHMNFEPKTIKKMYNSFLN